MERTEETKIVFKKKSAKSERKRKRVLENDIFEENQEEGTLIKDLLEDAKYKTIARRRNKGLEAESEEQLRKKQKLDGYEKKSKLQLEDAFTMETRTHDADIQMEKFIEEKLKEKRQAERPQEEKQEPKELDPISQRDTILYTTPDHLQPKRVKKAVEKSEMLTSIVEVDLPIEYKLQNIEQTEKAKHQLQQEKGKQSNLPAPNSQLHQRFKVYNRNFAPGRATDDIVAEQFKRKARGW